MTRATSSPVVRIVQISDGEMVAEVRGDTLTLRPLRTRRGGPAEISVKWGPIYYRAMLEKTSKPRKKNRRNRK